MAAIIPKETIEEIKLRCEISEVIGSYFNIQRAGTAFKALCPFHKEKSPSFHINMSRQIFHCFGCGEGGDVVRFVMLYEGVEFMTAIKMLAQRAGITLRLEDDDGVHGAQKDVLYKLHHEIADSFHRCLLERPAAAHAREYLQSRSIDAAAIEEFRIGFAPDSWSACLQWAEKKQYTQDQLETAGLIIRSTNPDSRSPFYDRFRNRLMFPICDEQGRVIGFSGRLLEADAKAAKYVNSPETPLFQKSNVLYALHQARQHIVQSREAVICEGQIDVIRCQSAGFATAVAGQGTAVTENHARKLKRYADSVIIAFDSDAAGRDSAIRTARLFLNSGLAVRIATLPPGGDPDTVITEQGADAFRSILDAATSLLHFHINVLQETHDTKSEIGLMRATRAVLETISQSPNAVQRAKLVQEAAQRLNIPVEALHSELKQVGRQTRARSRGETEPEAPAAPAFPPEELELARHLVHAADHPELARLVESYLRFELVSSEPCRHFIECSIESAKTGQRIQDLVSARAGEDRSGALWSLTSRVLEEPSKSSGREYTREDAVRDLILGIWKRRLSAERQGLAAENVERQTQLTYDIKALGQWDSGSVIIEMEMENLAEA
ncbi:MAG: DNA primase [Verrucomicrobia bacterium]|nr:DNA primase [Verrucomicrobiota bacterium]MDA1085829.1 DNA primase [Verrucomicrobiota bacterium]